MLGETKKTTPPTKPATPVSKRTSVQDPGGEGIATVEQSDSPLAIVATELADEDVELDPEPTP